MKSLDHIQALYFVGIGGIGMSSLARYFKLQGKEIYGYDKTQTQLTDELIEEGINVVFEDSVSNIPESVLDRDKIWVIYTPAVPKGNKILNYFAEEAYTLMKRAALLGKVSDNTLCLAVAGTHGKTTTSAILGHLLAACNMPVTAFLGGIAENYNSNLIYKGGEISVVEADEFDRSFLQLHPDIACITSMDADHLDIYGDLAQIETAFHDFADLVKDKDNLLFEKSLLLKGKSVSLENSSDYEAQNIRIDDNAYVFDLKTPTVRLESLKFYLPGHHNLTNAVMALGMAILAGAPLDLLPGALASFKGVKRRFSYKIKTEELVLIDDYAHHPTELNALFQAVAEMYPQDKKQIVFQPHLFSRTQDFAEGFAESLSQFDEVVLLDIYPAREEPIEGVTSEWLLKQVKAPSKILVQKSELSEVMLASKARVKLLVGAGDIGTEVDRITKILKS